MIVYDEADQSVEDIEVSLFIEAVYKRYGYDFRDYSRSHMKRRIVHRMKKDGHKSISLMQHHVLHDSDYFTDVLPEFSVNVSEMFRDPDFFGYFRKEVIPYLATFPKLKIWHAGCASGEEVYSMAIILKEEGLYDRVTIYATDFNDNILEAAREGVFSHKAMREFTANYIASGGKGAFSDYYTAKQNTAILDPSLKENISFLNHNLVTDSAFGQMDLILCRNVLIYFNRNLQDRVYHLFMDSLKPFGTICLGMKETMEYSSVSSNVTVLEPDLKVYRKRNVR